MVDGLVSAVSTKLASHIAGQDEAVKTITSAISSWELNRQSSKGEPLVLAFTGPTGVGKSETSFRIAEAILAAKRVVGKRHVPEGLLVLRGEDYTSTSELAQRGVGEVHKHIRSRLEELYRRCGGNAVVVMDEVQKVVPGALEALNQLLGDRGSINIPIEPAYYCGALIACARSLEVSTANTIFIFISDIAMDSMVKLLLAYEHRSLIPTQLIRGVVKEALDQQWERLLFGKYVNEVVPLLPLEKVHIEQIFALKLRGLGAEHRHAYWWNLAVDAGVVSHLSSSQFIKYTNHTTVLIPKKGEAGDDNVDIDHNSIGESRTKIFASYGARGIENAGPLQDLKALLFGHMQPWRPEKLLHVGLTSLETAATIRGSAGVGVNARKEFRPEIYLQWCTPAASMFASEVDYVSIVSIPEHIALSENCATAWVGQLS
jgi:DNA polymerase III delta prime subunit